MEDNNINTMEWPAQSLDINIIENLWLKIKRKIDEYLHGITTVKQLYKKQYFQFGPTAVLRIKG